MRLENSKNYSPLDSIRAAKLAKANTGNGVLEGPGHGAFGEDGGAGGGEEKPVKDFRERLVDFLMYVLDTQNQLCKKMGLTHIFILHI